MKLIIDSLILISYKVFVFDRLERKRWRLQSASCEEECSTTSKGTLKNLIVLIGKENFPYLYAI